MRYLIFILFTYMLAVSAYAGPDDKWTYVGSTGLKLDGIGILLAVGAFVWAYVIYRDMKTVPRKR